MLRKGENFKNLVYMELMYALIHKVNKSKVNNNDHQNDQVSEQLNLTHIG